MSTPKRYDCIISKSLIIIFISKIFYYIYIVFHLTSVIQNVPLHLCVYIFEKEIQRIRSFLLLQPLALNSEEMLIGEHLLEEVIPLHPRHLPKISASVKRQLRGFTQQRCVHRR